MSLSLPELPLSIPQSFSFGGGSRNLIDLAAAFAEAGLLDVELSQQDVATADGLLSMLKSAIQRAVGDDLSYAVIHGEWLVNLTDTDANLISLSMASDFSRLADTDRAILYAEAPFSDLEAAAPGLGRWAMAVIGDAAFPMGVGLTPMGALDAAQAIYWGGCANEDEFLEEWDEEDELPDLPSRDSLFGELPAWAIEGDAEVLPYLSEEEAYSASRALKHTALANLAAQVIALYEAFPSAHEVFAHGDNSIDANEPTLAMPFVLRWHPDDQLARPFDDLINDRLESGGENRLCYFEVTATVDGVNTFIERIARTSKLLRLIDNVALAIRDYRS